MPLQGENPVKRCEAKLLVSYFSFASRTAFHRSVQTPKTLNNLNMVFEPNGRVSKEYLCRSLSTCLLSLLIYSLLPATILPVYKSDVILMTYLEKKCVHAQLTVGHKQRIPNHPYHPLIVNIHSSKIRPHQRCRGFFLGHALCVS